MNTEMGLFIQAEMRVTRADGTIEEVIGADGAEAQAETEENE